tara:strand:+ start:32 stop:484 length:453 start_codon:yes stop_codon:yes gene_type:complete
MNHISNVIESGITSYIACEDKKEKAAIKYGIKMLMRQLVLNKCWSKKAHQVALDNNWPLDMNWYNQNKYDKGRKELLMEHKNPVEEIWQKLCASPWDTQKILKKEIHIVWVTRKEDAELTRLGYRSKRPDSDKAYREAGIEILCSDSSAG